MPRPSRQFAVAVPADRSGPDWWPAEVKRVAVDGCEIAYVDQGRGEPVVFVHGVVASMGYWRFNVPYIAGSRRAVALDLPGAGRSDKPDLSYSIPCLAGYLLRFLDVLGVERATLVGNSLGGLVAIAAALAEPSRVSRLVLVNSAGVRRSVRRLLRVPLAGAMRGFGAVRPPNLLYSVIFKLAFPTRPDLARYFAWNYRVGARTADYAAFHRSSSRTLAAILNYPVYAAARGLRMPTLLVWGERDRMLPPHVARRLARTIPDSRLVTYPDSGHCAMLDDPERFNEDLRVFLDL